MPVMSYALDSDPVPPVGRSVAFACTDSAPAVLSHVTVSTKPYLDSTRVSFPGIRPIKPGAVEGQIRTFTSTQCTWPSVVQPASRQK
jgi:hypothetical protein